MPSESLISPEGLDTLRRLAAQVPADQAIVEIGAFRGGATCAMAEAAAAGAGAHVWAIDPWDLPGNPDARWAARSRAVFERRVKARRLSDWITQLRAFSADVAARWDGPKVGLLFIDGDHREQTVRADWVAWRLHLAASAPVVFDDYRHPAHPGVAAVVDSLPELGCEFQAGRLAVGRYDG